MGMKAKLYKVAKVVGFASLVMMSIHPKLAWSALASKEDVKDVCKRKGGVYFESGEHEYGCHVPDGRTVYCIDYANECVIFNREGLDDGPGYTYDPPIERRDQDEDTQTYTPIEILKKLHLVKRPRVKVKKEATRPNLSEISLK